MLRNKKFWFLAVLIMGILAFFLVADGLQVLKRWASYNVPIQSRPPAGENNFLKAPEGVTVSVFADKLTGPRVIVFDPLSRMLVSEPKEGKVLVLEDKNKDGTADETRILLEGLRSPHGLAFYEEPETRIQYLYVAETQQVARYVYNTKTGKIDDKDKIPQNIVNLPADGRHFTRTIAFGPNYRKEQIVKGYDGLNTLTSVKLYISVGSSCDVCVEDSWKRAAILESDPEGSFTAEFAGGLRNSVFFTFHPVTKEIWATDMGRDNLGDDLPPDEVNIVRAAEPGEQFGALRYGWPFCYGDRVRDKSFDPAKVQRTDLSSDCSKTKAPVIQIPAHSAPLGLAFVPPSPSTGGWPLEWQNDLLVAYHGSWNRSVPTGYKIVKFKLNGNKVVAIEDFISGWFKDNKISGRPVDLKFGPDGALYISDDAAGIIYRATPR